MCAPASAGSGYAAALAAINARHNGTLGPAMAVSGLGVAQRLGAQPRSPKPPPPESAPPLGAELGGSAMGAARAGAGRRSNGFSSRYRGVTWDKRGKKWKAQVRAAPPLSTHAAHAARLLLSPPPSLTRAMPDPRQRPHAQPGLVRQRGGRREEVGRGRAAGEP